MLSWFMIPGMILAIGVSGLVWWALKEFTQMKASKADGISVISGLAVAFSFSLYHRGLIKEPIQVGVMLLVLLLSYGLVQWEKKSRNYSSKRKSSSAL